VRDSIVSNLIDQDYEELELRAMAHAECTWCENQGTIFLMGSLYCESCANEFRELHAKVTTNVAYDPEKC
jgi:hypothetical protein